MGQLVDGQWQEETSDRTDKEGRFVRRETAFRDWITADGSSGFQAVPDRYHLYISLACPWAHRTLIFRGLMGLDNAISLSVVDPFMGSEGWVFSDRPGCIPDTVNGFSHLHQVYTAAMPDYTGRVSVPVLWDKQQRTIVNNESAEIIRMFNDAFDNHGEAASDLYPPELRSEIDQVNSLVFEHLNNGVYKAGFASSQAAYEDAFDQLFGALDELEARLARHRYLAGDRITEADWRLFTTLVRFDPVYHFHFKCNLRRLTDYQNLWNYTRELYQVPGLAETVNFEHIKGHYYGSHETINPTRIVPKGPAVDFTAPHNRDRLPVSGHD